MMIQLCRISEVEREAGPEGRQHPAFRRILQ